MYSENILDLRASYLLMACGMNGLLTLRRSKKMVGTGYYLLRSSKHVLTSYRAVENKIIERQSLRFVRKLQEHLNTCHFLLLTFASRIIGIRKRYILLCERRLDFLLMFQRDRRHKKEANNNWNEVLKFNGDNDGYRYSRQIECCNVGINITEYWLLGRGLIIAS